MIIIPIKWLKSYKKPNLPPKTYRCVWKCCVPHCSQWFCWSLFPMKNGYKSLGILTQHFQTNPNGCFFQPWDSWVHFQAKPDAWMRRKQQHCFSEWHTLDFTRGQDHVLKQSLKHSSYELYRISLKLQEFYSLRKCNSHHHLVVTKQAISIGENMWKLTLRASRYP